MKKNTERRIIVGDVHGHYDGLMMLLNAIVPNAADRVYFLGDLIDRGPHSAKVVDFVRQNSYSCLLGNHEQMLMDSFPNPQKNEELLQGWLYCGGQMTLDSYKGNRSKLLEDIDWLQTLPLYLDLGDIWLVHAGLDPAIPLEEQTREQFCWIRDRFHYIKAPYFPNKLIIIGHTITLTLPGVPKGNLARGQGWLGIDTGVYHPLSGWLTAVDMTYEQVYQVNVFSHRLRILSLQQAETWIKPKLVFSRR
jgi:serine/threonine protein phosphatase 1